MNDHGFQCNHCGNKSLKLLGGCCIAQLGSELAALRAEARLAQEQRRPVVGVGQRTLSLSEAQAEVISKLQSKLAAVTQERDEALTKAAQAERRAKGVLAFADRAKGDGAEIGTQIAASALQVKDATLRDALERIEALTNERDEAQGACLEWDARCNAAETERDAALRKGDQATAEVASVRDAIARHLPVYDGCDTIEQTLLRVKTDLAALADVREWVKAEIRAEVAAMGSELERMRRG